jgi:uncharacterized membrane protein
VKPVKVSVEVARPREEVFDYIDVLANHEAYMDHIFDRWNLSGPVRGVGAKAKTRVAAPGSNEVAEFEVVESVSPERTVETAVSANGKRRTRGTYTLVERPGGGTEINFEVEWVEPSKTDRMIPPLTRAFLRRALGKGMRRLAKQLEGG